MEVVRCGLNLHATSVEGLIRREGAECLTHGESRGCNVTDVKGDFGEPKPRRLDQLAGASEVLALMGPVIPCRIERHATYQLKRLR